MQQPLAELAQSRRVSCNTADEHSHLQWQNKAGCSSHLLSLLNAGEMAATQQTDTLTCSGLGTSTPSSKLCSMSSESESAAAAARQQKNSVASILQTECMLRIAKHCSMSNDTAQAGHCRDTAGRTKLFQLLNERTQVNVKIAWLTRAGHDHEGHGVLSLAPLLCRQIIAAAVKVEMGVHELLG